jgi:hypothetical protein
LQLIQPLGNRKTLLPDQSDIEQRKIRGAIGDHLKRTADVSRGSDRLHPETKNCFLEVERDDQVILDNQHIVGHAIGRDVRHLTHEGSRRTH